MEIFGTLIAIVQEATDKFTPGERVRLIESNGNTRVSH
jgi:outer membrane lipoprotein SlyB